MPIKFEQYATPDDMEYSVILNTDRDKVKFIIRHTFFSCLTKMYYLYTIILTLIVVK